MPTQVISAGPVFAMLQNVVYALPSVRCQLLSEQVVQTSAQFGSGFSSIIGSNVEPGVVVQGGFVKCTIANTNVIVKRHTIGPFVQSYDKIVVADGATNYWRLNGTSGPVLDSIGTLHGSIVGTVTRGVAGPGSDLATQFTGLGYISLPSLTIPLNCSIELWVKTADLKQFNMIFTNRTSGLPSNHMIILQDGQPQYASGGNQIFPTSFTMNDGNWHQVVATSHTSGVKLFIDKVEKVNGAFTYPATTAVAKIGGDDFSGNSIMTVSDVALYPFPLSSTQIATHYQTRR